MGQGKAEVGESAGVFVMSCEQGPDTTCRGVGKGGACMEAMGVGLKRSTDVGPGGSAEGQLDFRNRGQGPNATLRGTWEGRAWKPWGRAH